MPVETWVKRPVAVRMCGPWDGSARSAQEIEGFVGPAPDGRPGFRRTPGPARVWDRLHETWVRLLPGQYVVEGVVGENYPIDPGVRDRTYERAPAGVASPARTRVG